MGELLHLPVWQATEWPAPLDLLHGRGVATWALTPRHDATSLFDLQAPDRLALVVPPEGTRAKVTRWKTGFYYIALGAGVLTWSRRK